MEKYDDRIHEAGRSAGCWVSLEEKKAYDHAKQCESSSLSFHDWQIMCASVKADESNNLVVKSSIHPDTGEIIPLPFRMSAFVPTNILICVSCSQIQDMELLEC